MEDGSTTLISGNEVVLWVEDDHTAEGESHIHSLMNRVPGLNEGIYQ